jgi:hypothetical protein
MPIRADQLSTDEKIALAVLSVRALHPAEFIEQYWQALKEATPGAPAVSIGPAEERLQKQDAGSRALSRLSVLGLAENIGYLWNLTGVGRDVATALTQAAGVNAQLVKAGELAFLYDERIFEGKRYGVVYGRDGLGREKPLAEWAGDRWVPTAWALGAGLLDEEMLAGFNLPRPGQIRPGQKIGRKLTASAAFVRALAEEGAAGGTDNPLPR